MIITSLATTPQGQQTSCARTHTVSGSLTIELLEGNATGRANSQQIILTETSFTGPCGPFSPTTFSILNENAPVNGGPSALTFTTVAQLQNTAYTIGFTGSHSGDTITGTITISVASQAATGPNQPNLIGSTSFPITLTARR
jgi:hypothetical protein